MEIYKTLNDLNPGYMKDIFQVQQSAYSTRRLYNIKVPRVNQQHSAPEVFGTKELKSGITYQTHSNRLRLLKFLKFD